jgi:UDP-N-acetylglucosamine 2-epimerase (non-hydrolysing)
MMELYCVSLESDTVSVTEPVGYREMIALLSNARFCLTDSGGLMEEAGVLRVPGLILRRETEHVRYVESGIHTLVGTEPAAIAGEAERLSDDAEHRRRVDSAPDNVGIEPVERIMGHLRTELS